MRDGFRRAVERVLPWYDHEAEAIRQARSERIHERSIAARIEAESERMRVASVVKATVKALRDQR